MMSALASMKPEEWSWWAPPWAVECFGRDSRDNRKRLVLVDGFIIILFLERKFRLFLGQQVGKIYILVFESLEQNFEFFR